MKIKIFIAFLFLAILIIPSVSFITVESMFSEAIRQEAELKLESFQKTKTLFHHEQNLKEPSNDLFQEIQVYLNLFPDVSMHIINENYERDFPYIQRNSYPSMTVQEAKEFVTPMYRIPEANTNVLEIIIPIHERMEWLYTVRIVSPIQTLQVLKIQQYNKLVLISLFFLAAASILTAVVSKLVMGPISQLADWSSNLQVGMQISAPPESSSREVGIVSSAFKDLSGQIRKTILNLHKMADNQSSFVNQFTHEIRTPLTSILGHLELIKNPQIADDMKSEAIEYLEKSARRILTLSEKMSSLIEGRTRNLITEKIFLQGFFRECLVELQPIIDEKNITIETFLTKRTVYADYTLLKTACINLLKNSIKASSEYDRITISVNESMNVITIAIIDQGRGISDTELNRINSTEFVPRKDRQGGFGLGLWICKEIAAAHSGELRLSRNKLTGTTAEIQLPGDRDE